MGAGVAERNEEGVKGEGTDEGVEDEGGRVRGRTE